MRGGTKGGEKGKGKGDEAPRLKFLATPLVRAGLSIGTESNDLG